MKRKRMEKLRLCFLTMLILVFMKGIAPAQTEESTMEEKKMETVYRQALTRYLVEALELKDYDAQLAESEEGFLPTQEEYISEAQKEGDMGLTYIYLRNVLHLERLEEDERQTLLREKLPSQGSEPLSEDLMNLIQNTYAQVIAEKEIKQPEDRKVLTFYDSRLQQDFVTVDTLVLKIATMPAFDAQGNYADQEHEYEKTDFLEAFAQQMEEDLQGRLGETPIRVMVE